MMQSMLAQVSFATSLGRCAVRWTERGIAAVSLPGGSAPEIARLDEIAPLASGLVMPLAVRSAIDGMIALLAGELRHLREVIVDERGLDAFRRDVYAATRLIDPASTASYGQIARTIGRPDAARDVGVALARNPFPIVVPCHRVLAANGALTGFSAPGGIVTKRRLLQLEGAPGFGQLPLFG